jgi:nifR3 family TIM-barrel protein
MTNLLLPADIQQPLARARAEALPETFQKPIEICGSKGRLLLHSRVVLAPMAGVTDTVFRGLVRQWAPQSLICTEMISSNSLVHNKRGMTAFILEKSAHDPPIAYQLAAHREDVLLQAAAAILKEKRPDLLDLNMGCPVKKITGNFEGCALMKEPRQAQQLITALVREVDCPVTVKFRLGWDNDSMNYLAFGRMCEDAGASMVTLHARTRSQGYQPGCKWEAFGELKQALSIPVIANGDIHTWEDAHHIMSTYGVDGVMMGRGCLGEPWLVGAVDAALKTGEAPPVPSLAQRMQVALEHARTYASARGETLGIREMRKHLAWYAKQFPGASQVRHRFTQVQSLAEVEAIIADVLEISPAGG